MLQEQLFASHAIAGVGSVALGTAVSYPLDTIKLLIQVSLFVISMKSKYTSILLFLLWKAGWFKL